MPPPNASPRILVQSDARVVSDDNWLERGILIALLVLLYMSYGALGRDIFYNHLMFAHGADVEDPIGAVLPYVRVFLCLLAISVVVLGTSFNWAFSKVPWILAPLIIFALVSFRWADNPKDTIRNAVQTTTMWLALSMVIHRLGLATTVRVTVHLIAWVCIISFFLAIAFPKIGQHSGLEAVQQSHKGEWRGIFAHKNALGPWAAWGSLVLFTHSWFCGGFRLYWWVARICAVTCLVFSHSATSVVVAALLWATWISFLLLRRVSLASFLSIVVIPVCAGIFLWFEFKSDLFAALGRDETFTGRTLIWAIDAEFFKNSPLLGHGFQMMGGKAFNERLVAVFDQPLGPESAYWTMLLDMGIVGAALFFIPFALAIRNGFEWMKHVVLVDRACLEMLIILLLSVLVIGFTESQVLLSTGFDGVLSFTALFALLTTPKSPEGVLRGEFRLAKYRLPPMRQSVRARRPDAYSIREG